MTRNYQEKIIRMASMNDADRQRQRMVETGQPERDLAGISPSSYPVHEFSTPDGNKTYCKTCGYTEQAGNHAGAAGQRWTTAELQRDFEVTGFAAPFVVVRRKSDGQLGSLEFTNCPRVYFGWRPDEGE